MDLKEWSERTWIGFHWPKISTSGGLKWTWQWNFGLFIMRWNRFTTWERISFSSRRKFPWRRYIKHKGTETRGYSDTLNVKKKTPVYEYIYIWAVCRLLNKMAVSLVASVTWSNSKWQMRRLKGQVRQHKQYGGRTFVYQAKHLLTPSYGHFGRRPYMHIRMTSVCFGHISSPCRLP